MTDYDFDSISYPRKSSAHEVARCILQQRKQRRRQAIGYICLMSLYLVVLSYALLQAYGYKRATLTLVDIIVVVIVCVIFAAALLSMWLALKQACNPSKYDVVASTKDE